MNTGVYKITNIESGKIYVGSAAQSLRQRWINHTSRLRKGDHPNKYLQNAWDFYGSQAFRFEVLEYCEPSKCLNREQYYLDMLRPYDRGIGYNLASIAGSILGTSWSPVTRKKHELTYLKKNRNVKAIIVLSKIKTAVAKRKTLLTSEQVEEAANRYVAVGHGKRGSPNQIGALAKEYGVSRFVMRNSIIRYFRDKPEARSEFLALCRLPTG